MGFFRIPPDPEIIFICQVCPVEFDTGEKDWATALKKVQAEGWETGKDNNGYYHLCKNHAYTFTASRR